MACFIMPSETTGAASCSCFTITAVTVLCIGKPYVPDVQTQSQVYYKGATRATKGDSSKLIVNGMKELHKINDLHL